MEPGDKSRWPRRQCWQFVLTAGHEFLKVGRSSDTRIEKTKHPTSTNQSQWSQICHFRSNYHNFQPLARLKKFQLFLTVSTLCFSGDIRIIKVILANNTDKKKIENIKKNKNKQYLKNGLNKCLFSVELHHTHCLFSQPTFILTGVLQQSAWDYHTETNTTELLLSGTVSH